jgi:putative PIN family toxin of toxin-antitoxin system
MARIVLDTNILVSAIIASGYSAAILDRVRSGELALITSTHLLEEFSDVIARPRITRKYPQIAEKAEDLVDFLRAFTELVQGTPGESQISRDRDDDYMVACAVEGNADYIISGDPHLLDLRTHGNITILTPREFVEQVLRK